MIIFRGKTDCVSQKSSRGIFDYKHKHCCQSSQYHIQTLKTVIGLFLNRRNSNDFKKLLKLHIRMTRRPGSR